MNDEQQELWNQFMVLKNHFKDFGEISIQNLASVVQNELGDATHFDIASLKEMQTTFRKTSTQRILRELSRLTRLLDLNMQQTNSFLEVTIKNLERKENAFAHDLHTCNEHDCQICIGGLAYCNTCKGAEGDLPTDCPGRPLTKDESYDIYKTGTTDFIQGEWVRKGPRKKWN